MRQGYSVLAESLPEELPLGPTDDLAGLGEPSDFGAALVEAGRDTPHSKAPLIHLLKSLPSGDLQGDPAAGRFAGSPEWRDREDARILRATDGP